MAAFTGNGYLVENLSALRAIPLIDRPPFKVAILVAGLGWYEYDNAATTGGIVPSDNPASGRWFLIGRETLRANRTYFVRTDGNDNNIGLVNTSGGAFLTIQKAIDVVASLDISIFDVTIQVADGTYSQSLTLKTIIGSGTIFLTGNTTTPANVVINAPSNPTVFSATQSLYEIKGFTLTSSNTASQQISIQSANGNVNFGNIVFPSFTISGGFHLVANGSSSQLKAVANYAISGGGAIHALGTEGGFITCRNKTITLNGTPNFSSAFAWASVTGMVDFVSNTYSGGATGTRYNAILNGVIVTQGGTLAGSIAGTIATGGQYS